MLANPLNIEYLRSKFKLTPEQLCVFALIRKDNKILMGLREYIKSKPVWTYPGGRGKSNETLIDTLKREILEEIGISDIELIKVIGQKDGVKKDDRVYFIECKISSDPKLMEPEKFKEWKWFPLDQLPDNLIDSNDLVFLKRLK